MPHNCSIGVLSNIVEGRLQDAIGELVRDLLKRLEDQDSSVRVAVVKAVSALGAHGMCQRLSRIDILIIVEDRLQDAIRASIPALLKHLEDQDLSVRNAVVKALSTLCTHGICKKSLMAAC